MEIIVKEINNETSIKDNERKIKYINEIICPECEETVKIKFENYKVKLFKYKNGHEEKILTLSEFKNLITKDESKIICDLCKAINKSQANNNIFYYCFTCNQKFCPICKSKHEKDNDHVQRIIDYDLKNYYCNEHNEQYNSYCKKCEKNICIKCINKHNEHGIINYQNILQKEEEKEKDLKILRNKIDQMIEYLNEVIYTFHETIKNFELYKRI